MIVLLSITLLIVAASSAFALRAALSARRDVRFVFAQANLNCASLKLLTATVKKMQEKGAAVE